MMHNQGQMHLVGSTYIFGISPATTKTSRALAIHGTLSFDANSSWSGASNLHYVDGYAKTYGVAAFVAPVGDGGVYAPVQVSPSVASGVAAAYFNSSPTLISVEKDASILAISPIEYWKIEGAASKISLSWRPASNVGSLPLTPSLDFLTLVGYNGTQWVEIPSFYDSVSFLGASSSLSSGSITSLADVNLADFTAFAIGSKLSASCYPAITSSGVTKTWNGTNWLPTAPNINDPVIINAAYSGNLSCYSVQLNANITLNDDQKLDVVDSFIGTGKVVMATTASLVQRNSTATAPIVVMSKTTNPMRRYDYVFLSSPITNTTTFFANLLSNQNVAVDGNFGVQPQSAFEQMRTYNAAGLSPIDATPANTPVGRGFSATVRKQAPYSLSNDPAAWFTEKNIIQIKTEGVANNGDIPVVVPENGWVRIGNPYPSPINAVKLLDAMGPNVRKTLYYWTFRNPRGSLAAASYNNADYAMFNYQGGIAECATCDKPTGIIASMQSILTKALTGTGSTTFNLTNCLRDLNGNDDFYKSNNQSDAGKYRLNFVGSVDSFSQLLIAYDPVNGTVGFDNGYDAGRLAGTSSELNSLIESSKYAIQTRPGFTADDVVPLQLDNRTEEHFTISLVESEGVFDTASIFLHDKVLAIYHDLKLGSYSFAHNSLDLHRFDLVYQNPLSTNDFQNSNASAFINKKVLKVQAAGLITSIQIFDLTGRLVHNYKEINQNTFNHGFYYAQGVYIAKIKLDSGKIVTQKLINSK